MASVHDHSASGGCDLDCSGRSPSSFQRVKRGFVLPDGAAVRVESSELQFRHIHLHQSSQGIPKFEAYVSRYVGFGQSTKVKVLVFCRRAFHRL